MNMCECARERSEKAITFSLLTHAMHFVTIDYYYYIKHKIRITCEINPISDIKINRISINVHVHCTLYTDAFEIH